MIEKKCLICSRPFTVVGKQVGYRVHCSRSCSSITKCLAQRTKGTNIERRMATFLDLLGVKYEAQKPFPGIGVVDFYLPEQHIAVEVDGTYWHSRPETVISDARKDAGLDRIGVTVIRVPGTELGEEDR